MTSLSLFAFMHWRRKWQPTPVFLPGKFHGLGSLVGYSPWLGVDCGSDHELLIAKFRLKFKKVGKTTRPFKYDLNQIPYNYTVVMMNRFKGLDLVDRVPEELWTEVCDIV